MEHRGVEKKVVVFDLDRTLAESKSPIDLETSSLLGKLLESKKVAVISGGSFAQFEKQFLSALNVPGHALSNLYLLPTSGTALYVYDNEWENAYQETLTHAEREDIKKSFEKALQVTATKMPDKLYGEQIEDRGSQITFSALGQKAPIELKQQWDQDLSKRELIKKELEKLLPGFEIQIGGSTSIDVTRKGMDKGYGVHKLSKHLHIPVENMLFIGDRLMEGGNDYSVLQTGMETIEVSGPEETKKIILDLIKRQ